MILPLILASVITGNASTETRVTTSVSGGEGVVETRIVNEVNGQRVEIQHNEPGSVEVKQENGTSSVTINGVPVTPTLAVVAAPVPEKKRLLWRERLGRLTSIIRSFFSRLLDNVK